MSTNEPSTADEQIFAARISPHRSLSSGGVRTLLVVFSGASFLLCIPFVLLGAWPVALYLLLDAALFGWALRANRGAARAYETVRLTPVELEVARVTARGAKTEWRFNPFWVRIERHEHEEFGLQRLSLVSRGRRIEIAGFLGPGQKAEFADALAHALAVARRGPRFS